MGNTINTKLFEEYINEHKISKTKFCKLCKISPSTFKKIMKNDFHFKISALFKIARVLDIEVYQMFE